MSFISPEMFSLLISIPLFVLLYLRLQLRRKRIAEAYNKFGLAQMQGRDLGRRRHVPLILFLVGLTVLIVALTRPQAVVSLPKIQGTIILAFDVSGSMAADDLQPTRMEAAKAAARQFVDKQPSGISIGVVVFSDGGISVQPPTDNREETLSTIDRLVPRRGTSIGNGILVALNTIAVDAGDPPILNTNDLSQDPAVAPVEAPQGWYPSAVIVLFSDGENNQEPDPAMAAELAADLGVRVYTVGVGTTAGTAIEVEGMTVHSSLDEAMLLFIANESGGSYYNAGNQEELGRIYRDIEPKLSIKPEEIEMTSVFAGLGMIVFLIGGMLSLLWFGHVP